MKKYFLLLFLGSVSFILVSQNKDIDSVLNLLKTAKQDTNHVKNLNNLSWYYMDEAKYDESLKYAQQALTLAKSVQYKQGEVIALSYIGLTYHLRNDFASALNYYYQEQKEYETYDNKKSQAKNLSNIGNVFSDKGDYIKALDFYFQSLKINETIKYREGIASAYNNIGIIYNYQGNYDKTLEFFFKALQINTELKRQRGIVNALGNIGNIYYFQHKYSKALEYQLKAMKMNEASGNKSALSDNYGNIAITYNDQSDADFIAQGLQPADRFKLSTEFSFKALKLNEELKSQYGITVNFLNIGAAYLKANKFTDAETYCLKGLTLAKTDGYLELVKEGAQKLSDVYQNLSNQKKALEYFKMYIISRDSLQNEENTKKTVRLEMNYEFDKK
ncbi:MAG: tetratricopeptide repeat protein [Bacteroidia bacterium]